LLVQYQNIRYHVMHVVSERLKVSWLFSSCSLSSPLSHSCCGLWLWLVEATTDQICGVNPPSSGQESQKFDEHIRKRASSPKARSTQQ